MNQPNPSIQSLRSPQANSYSGFSLIEVLIVVAIVGILAAIGYPSYTQYVVDSRRADGHLALLEGSQDMERCKSRNYSYTGCSPNRDESSEGFYDLTVEANAWTYTLTATAKGPQATDSDCATITFNHLSVKGPKVGDAASVCWK